MPLAPLHLSHLAYDVFAVGYWFRVDGGRLFVVARDAGRPPLPESLAARIRAHKAGIIAAGRIIPPGCRNRPGHFYAGRCLQCDCAHLEESS